MKSDFNGINIQDFLLKGIEQVAAPQKDRMEVEEVARVIITNESVEIYKFNEEVIIVRLPNLQTNIFKNTKNGLEKLDDKLFIDK